MNRFILVLPIAAAVFSSCLSSIGVVFQSAAAKEVSPIALAWMANVFGAAAGWVLMRISSERVGSAEVRRNLKPLLILSICRGVIGGPIIWWSVSLTVGIKAMFLTKAEPYIVLLWDWIFERSRTSRRHLALLAVHVGGAVILSTGGAFSGGTAGSFGDLMLLLGLAVAAMSYRQGAELSVALGALKTNFLAHLIPAVVLLPPALLLTPEEQWDFGSRGWQLGFAAIAIWHFFGVVLWLLALKELPRWLVSALRATGPIVGAPFAWYFFSQTLNLAQLCGAAIVLATSAMLVKLGRDSRRAAPV